MPAALGSLRRPAVAVNAVLALLLAGGAFWAYETLSGPATGTAADASVRSVPVQQGTVTATVTADGSVESASTASASFVTGGTVTSIAVHVGDRVKKGQVLAKVDPAPAQRTLSAAEADLAAARDALARAEDAGSDTSSAQNEVTRAQLGVDEAQAGVDGTVLEAPMAGTVVAVNGTLGSSSQPSAQQGSADEASGFIDLADLGKLQVTAAFAEADATKLKEKQAATVTWNALSGTRQSAKVVAVDPQATTDGTVVTYGVTLSLDKVPAGAKPGQTVSVSVVTGEVAGALSVTSAAVTTVGNRHTVTVVANGVQETRQVEIGLEGDQVTQIISGLTAGEQVVIRTTTTTTGGTQGRLPGGGFGGLTGGGAPAGGGFPGGGTGRAGR
ncbi:efflux RND transporter periplasmic adaptor subunit [Nucisporomicrobium flavum]|uniref:efflux RND transporter periplasmic adaptor subunit n=1 Tax=Nucisporomicrobium flavum TaxID=2785915 RepID=UPI0018F45194|nr:efflux RND transporter periplasmic adaptor subunit [Nucisporomicrobium flavum]